MKFNYVNDSGTRASIINIKFVITKDDLIYATISIIKDSEGSWENLTKRNIEKEVINLNKSYGETFYGMFDVDYRHLDIDDKTKIDNIIKKYWGI